MWDSIDNIKILRKSRQRTPTWRSMLTVLHNLQKPDHNLPGLMIKLSRHQNLIPQSQTALLIKKMMGNQYVMTSQCENLNYI